ncbi:MAG: hypothetical protein R3E46_00565 [Sedimenticolaceae bacterium]
MILNVVIDDQLLELNVPEAFLQQAQDFFAKMDSDMDRGWQVNREWVEQPDRMLRAQIAANKLLTALENEDHNLGRLMAGYILSRVPEVLTVELNPAGETRDHRIEVAETASAAVPTAQVKEAIAHAGIPKGLNKMQAMAQAAKDVSKVFKMGKQYRFSVYNHATGTWEESPAIADKAQAESMREHAFKARFEALCG